MSNEFEETGFMTGDSGGDTATGTGAVPWHQRSRAWSVTLWRQRSGARFAALWLGIFTATTGLFLLRFLVSVPVGMADQGDGARIMCGLGVQPVTGGYARYDSYAYFQFAPSKLCGHVVYPSSQHLLLVAARWLTAVLGLPGPVNLVALGLISCVLAGIAIASLATGLRIHRIGQIIVAVALWLIVADSVFFDYFASPFSEGAALLGLLLVAAGCVYLRRGPVATGAGLVLATAGGYLAAMSKQEYQLLVIPVAATLLLAAISVPGTRPGRAWRRHLLNVRFASAALAAGLLLWSGVASMYSSDTSPYMKLLQQEDVVDTIFNSILLPGTDNTAALRALGLPVSWERYAGGDFWSNPSPASDPLYPRYVNRLTDANLVHFYATHPEYLLGIGQHAASLALQLRVAYLGNYAPSADMPPGALDNRVTVVSGLVSGVSGLGLVWLVPLWLVMILSARTAWRRRFLAPWRADAAVLLLCLTGCAAVAFIPAAYFDGAETVKHMAGMNLATALTIPVCLAVFASLLNEPIGAPERTQEAPALPLPSPAVLS
jgi:hypothetical protein